MIKFFMCLCSHLSNNAMKITSESCDKSYIMQGQDTPII